MNRFACRFVFFCTTVVIFLLLLSATPCGLAQSTLSAPPPLLLGTAWYPEQWPESRWDADLALMQQSRVHMVRVAEFAWSRMEPEEGKYDFDWLDHASLPHPSTASIRLSARPRPRHPPGLRKNILRRCA